MLNLVDIYEKIKNLEYNQYNGTQEDAELVEELVHHLKNAGRLMKSLGVYDDVDEVDDETWDKIYDSF